MEWTNEDIRTARKFEGGLVGVILIISVVEMVAYVHGILSTWVAFVMTPTIPILATLTLYIDYELTYRQKIWRGRWVKDDFRKTNLMILGIVILWFGFYFFLTSLGSDLNRIIIDTGSGTSLMCLGLYIVKRFAW